MNPTLLHLGPLEIRWYGLMYVISFLLGGKLMQCLYKEKLSPIPLEQVDNYITLNLIGMFFGARLFYVFVYNWDYYSDNLSELLAVWKGGLSFHGAVIGFLITHWYIAKKYSYNYLNLLDNLALAGTPGLFFGRIGNFINGELYGRTTNVPWGMVFADGGPLPRHPSQLYEGLMEGVFLSSLFWIIRKKTPFHGTICCLFLTGYGLVRFIVEFYREPDAQMGLYFNDTFSMGQILCMIMMIIGPILFFILNKRKRSLSATQ